jgi:predicted MFS family arabinose efflux permease
MNENAIPGAPEEFVRVFVSYAREDKRWLDPDYRYSLIPFLMESLRRHRVAFWFDKELKPGDEFRRFIESEIDQSQIALLIVSQSFLNSEFIENKEMPRIAERARQGKMIIVPVLVEPCDWSEYPFLADRQMVPSSPLIEYTESEPQWAKVRYQILDGLKAQLKRIREVQPAAVQAQKPEVREPDKPSRLELPKPEIKPAKAAEGLSGLEQELADADRAANPNPKARQSAAPGLGVGDARRTLLLLFILNLLSWALRNMFAGVTGTVVEQLHLEYEQIQGLFATSMVCYAAAALLTGWLGDRWRRKPILLAGAAITCLAALAMDSTVDYSYVTLFDVLIWAGGAIFDVVALATISDFYSERDRCRALAIFYLATPLGSTLGSVGATALASLWGWAGPFVLCAILCMLVVALYGWLGREPERGSSDHIQPTRSRTTFRGLFANPAFLTATLGLTALSVALYAHTSFGPLILLRIFHDTFALNPAFGILRMVGAAAGVVTGGWLGQRWLRRSDRALYMLSFLSISFALPFYALFTFGSGDFAVPELLVGAFFLFLPIAPLYATAVNSVAASVRATAIAIFLVCGLSFSGIFASWIFTAIDERIGMRQGLGAILIFLVLSGLVLFIGARFAPRLGENAGSTTPR